MKTLESVAVFGLVPVPALTNTVIDSRCDRQAPCGDVDLWRLRPFTERAVKKEELARIREELEEIAKQAS